MKFLRLYENFDFDEEDFDEEEFYNKNKFEIGDIVVPLRKINHSVLKKELVAYGYILSRYKLFSLNKVVIPIRSYKISDIKDNYIKFSNFRYWFDMKDFRDEMNNYEIHENFDFNEEDFDEEEFDTIKDLKMFTLTRYVRGDNIYLLEMENYDKYSNVTTIYNDYNHPHNLVYEISPQDKVYIMNKRHSGINIHKKNQYGYGQSGWDIYYYEDLPIEIKNRIMD